MDQICKICSYIVWFTCYSYILFLFFGLYKEARAQVLLSAYNHNNDRSDCMTFLHIKYIRIEFHHTYIEWNGFK